MVRIALLALIAGFAVGFWYVSSVMNATDPDVWLDRASRTYHLDESCSALPGSSTNDIESMRESDAIANDFRICQTCESMASK